MLGLETPVERLQHMNQPAYEFYLNRNPGIDLAADRLEIGVCAQHNNGGIDVDLWWRSWEVGFDPDDPTDRVVMATRRAVFPLWGLDPWYD